MPNALDAFRAQREAAEAVYEQVQQVAVLIERLRADVEAVASNAELKRVLHDEQQWLAHAERTIAEVRRWREEERRRFWPGVLRRWIVALAFAIVSAAAAGAGYVWAMKPYAVELTDLHARLTVMEYIEQRIVRMTPSERRQFDTLIGGNRAPEPRRGK